MMLKKVVIDKITKVLHFLKKHPLIILGGIINFSFFISAFWTGWYDYFFFGSSIHYCCQGLDFYQIPNGVYAFIQGGDLSGVLPEGISAYSENLISNYNVYHPLLTILLGSFFLLFSPDNSFYLWTAIKIIVSFLLALYLYKEFKTNKYIDLAIFLMLINFSQYNDIRIAQYQFLLNTFLALFLIHVVKNKNVYKTGFLFFLILLSKPIGLLWIPVLFLKGKLRIIFLGFGLFLIATAFFQLIGIGDYYTSNLTSHLLHPVAIRSIDLMSMEALLRLGFNLDVSVISNLKLFIFFIILLFSLDKKIHILKVIFLLIVYFLFFYDLIFQYHFSILGPLLSICLLNLKEFQSKAASVLILLINLPTIFFIMRLLNIGVYINPVLGPDPKFTTWQVVSFFQLLPIVILVLFVIYPDLKRFSKVSLAIVNKKL